MRHRIFSSVPPLSASKAIRIGPRLTAEAHKTPKTSLLSQIRCPKWVRAGPCLFAPIRVSWVDRWVDRVTGPPSGGISESEAKMVRALNRLSAREVATQKKPGRHFDGGGYGSHRR